MQETIYDMLVILLANYYPSDVIFQAYQNNFVLPADGKFVVITEVPTDNVSYPTTNFIGSLPTGLTDISNLDVTTFQLDFYGAPANDCCKWTRIYLQSPDGTNYLAATGNVTVARIYSMINLTEVLDQRKYLPRFAFKFSLFNNKEISYGNYGINRLEPSLIKVL